MIPKNESMAVLKAVRGLAFGPDYLITMNPDFVVLLVREYLLYAPNRQDGKVQFAIFVMN